MRTKEQQEQLEAVLSEIELLIASERLQLEFDNSRLARAILALPQIGIIDQSPDLMKEYEGVVLIPKE